MVSSVWVGQQSNGFAPASRALGLVGFPALLLAWQWLRARPGAARLNATGPVGHLVNMLVFLALYLTPLYAPALAITSDAAVLFYGASMLLAAARGYAGCEVLAVSNWLLRRDDQIGCVVFWPVDALEQRWHGHVGAASENVGESSCAVGTDVRATQRTSEPQNR
jgi:hypothetical protein